MTGATAITASVTAQKTNARAAATRPCLIRSGLTVPLCAQFGLRGRRAVTLSANLRMECADQACTGCGCWPPDRPTLRMALHLYQARFPKSAALREISRRNHDQIDHDQLVAAARQEIIVRIVLATYVNGPGRFVARAPG
jgi:hypothetical protein